VLPGLQMVLHELKRPQLSNEPSASLITTRLTSSSC